MQANLGKANSKVIEELALLQIDEEFQIQFIKYIELNKLLGNFFAQEVIEQLWSNWMCCKANYKQKFIEKAFNGEDMYQEAVYNGMY